VPNFFVNSVTKRTFRLQYKKWLQYGIQRLQLLMSDTSDDAAQQVY